MTITVTASGISLDGPLVAGEVVAVSVSGVAFAEDAKPTLCLLGRFPDALLSSVELTEDENTPGTWTGELDTATKQTAAFFAAARADEKRDAVLELVAARQSIARLSVSFANSALCPSPFHAPDASPVYVPVPGPPGQGGDPYDQNPAMDGIASAGVSDKYARGDHVHPTDSSRAAQADVAAIQDVIPSTATPSNKLATAADLTGKANDADVVKLTGNQTIAGDKTFTGQVTAADIVTGYSVSFLGTDKYITAPENSGAALTDADLSDSSSALATALLAKADTSSLATVATTGDYGDLLNKPTIPAAQVNADWNASSGVAQILNKPTIPDVSGKADSAAIAPAFSSSSTYAVGDYVTHEGLLYKCSTAVSTAGAWDSTKWTAVAVTGEMGQSTPLPFDAEVDYVTFPAGAYVDPEIVDCGPATEYEVSLKAAHESTGFFRHGCWRGGTISSYMIYGTTAVSVAKNWVNTAGFTFSTGTPFTLKVNALSWEANGSTIGSTSSIADGRQNNARFLICALDNISEGSIDVSQVNIRIYQFDFTSETAIRRLVPVRIGTTGYLYDKVTGRLFGSATSTALVPGPDKAVPTITTPDRLVEIDERNNYLTYASTTTLAPETAVYRSALNNDGTFPTITDTAIPTASAYFQFELELTVPSTVPSTITGPTGWTWMDGGTLPDPSDLSGGETIYIACRLDCTARTIVANCYDVR